MDYQSLVSNKLASSNQAQLIRFPGSWK